MSDKSAYNSTLLFISACIGMFLFGIVLITLGSLLPVLSFRFNLDEIGAGSLISLLPFGILFGSLIFGILVDRYGYKWVLIISSFFVFATLQGIAFASTFIFLRVSIVFIGIAGGVINGATNALVADISSEQKSAKLSLLGVFFGVGALGMPMALAFLSSYFSTEIITASIGAFALITILYFTAIRFPVPKQPQGFPLKQGFQLLKDFSLIILGLFLFFQSGIEGIVNNWTTTYIQKTFEVTSQESLIALSWFVASMTVTRLFLGYFLRKLQSHLVVYFCLVISIIGIFILYFASAYIYAILAIILFGIGFAAGFPVILSYVAEKHPELSGTAFSIVFVIALVGQMSLTYGTGLVAHSFGFKNIVVIPLLSLIVMITILRIITKRVITAK